MHVLVFLLRRHPAPDMPLLFIHIQNLSCFLGKRRVDLHKPFRYVLMYRTLANPKLLCALPYCCVIFDNIIGNIDCSLLDIIFQRKPLRMLFYIL